MIVFEPCAAAGPAVGGAGGFPVEVVAGVGSLEFRLFVGAGGLAVTGLLVTVGVPSFVGVVVVAKVEVEVVTGFEVIGVLTVVGVLPFGAEPEVGAGVVVRPGAKPDAAFSQLLPNLSPASASGPGLESEPEPGSPLVMTLVLVAS